MSSFNEKERREYFPDPITKATGYHFQQIPKGTVGHFSKIKEKLAELEDAIDQDCRIMAEVELADLYGAIEAFAKDHYGLDMMDLQKMSDITKRAFRNGHR